MAVDELDEQKRQCDRDGNRCRNKNSGKEICPNSTKNTDPQDRFSSATSGSADHLFFCHVIVFNAHWNSSSAIYRYADEMSQTGSSLLALSGNMNFMDVRDLLLYGIHESAHNNSL